MSGMLFLPFEVNEDEWEEFTRDLRNWYMDRRQELEQWYAEKIQEAHRAFWELTDD